MDWAKLFKSIGIVLSLFVIIVAISVGAVSLTFFWPEHSWLYLGCVLGIMLLYLVYRIYHSEMTQASAQNRDSSDTKPENAPSDVSAEVDEIAASLRERGICMPTREREEKNIGGIKVIEVSGCASAQQIIAAKEVLDTLSFIPAGDYTEEMSDWSVAEDGGIINEKHGYHIEKERLSDMGWGINWISHVAEKGWVNLNSFIPVYFLALKRAGIDTLHINVKQNQIIYENEE